MYKDKVIFEKDTLIDVETGEVLQSTLKTNHNIEEYRKCNSDEFIMVYLKDLSGFLRLDNGTQIKLLAII